MEAILFALVAYIGWAVGDILNTIAARKIGALPTYFWFQLFALILSCLISPLFFHYLPQITVEIVVVNIILAFILTTGSLSFNQGLKIGNASLVGTIAASFSAVVVILSIIFLKEEVSKEQISAILIIIFGVILSTLDLGELANRKIPLGKGELFALIAMVCWGVYFTFIKIPVSQIGWFWTSFISGIVGFLIVSFRLFPGSKFNNFPKNKVLILILLGIALSFKAAEWGFNFAVSEGQVAIIAPIAGSYPTLFVILAFLVFKDPITRQQILGIITTLVGIVLLSFLSA